jgi:hypothetical protein
MNRKKKPVELYALKACRICNELVPPHSVTSKPYSKAYYSTLCTCPSPICRKEWRRICKKKDKTFSPKLEAIDYFILGIQHEYRQVLALEANQIVIYNMERTYAQQQ